MEGVGGLFRPNLGIWGVLHEEAAEGLAPARPLPFAQAVTKSGEALGKKTGRMRLEEALCPPAGDGQWLRPDIFLPRLEQCALALREREEPALVAMGELLTQIQADYRLLREQSGLLVAG